MTHFHYLPSFICPEKTWRRELGNLPGTGLRYYGMYLKKKQQTQTTVRELSASRYFVSREPFAPQVQLINKHLGFTRAANPIYKMKQKKTRFNLNRCDLQGD